jgi:protein required for attachment to host cells
VNAVEIPRSTAFGGSGNSGAMTAGTVFLRVAAGKVLWEAFPRLRSRSLQLLAIIARQVAMPAGTSVFSRKVIILLFRQRAGRKHSHASFHAYRSTLMATMKIGTGEWIVVCDGRKAIILENVGDRLAPTLQTKEVLEHTDATTRAQGTDSPGRVHASMGHARSSVEQTDWHDEAERSFLKGVADRLDIAIMSGETTTLNVVAAPRALGMIRHAYSPAVRKALKVELDRDLVKLPVHEIEKHLLA